MSAQPEPRSVRDRELWAAVDRLVERAPSLADLASHRIELFAARKWRAEGKEVPEAVVAQEHRAAIATLTAPVLLRRVREAYDGTIVLIKGSDVAQLYPAPALRLFGDLDLLVDDAEAAQAALLSAGFREIGDSDVYVDHHHLHPLQWPELPLAVEIHSRPNWAWGLKPPRVADLFACARIDADGIGHLPSAEHAVILAVHSWAHDPLQRLRDLIDVAVMANSAGRDDVAIVAEAWGVKRLWNATAEVVDAVFHDRPRPWSLRLWAQNLETARERTVFENHVQRWLSDFWIVSPPVAIARIPSTFARELLPERNEGWRSKLARSSRALRNASRRRSEHDEQLAEARRDARR